MLKKKHRTFLLNANVITGDNGKVTGAVVTFLPAEQSGYPEKTFPEIVGKSACIKSLLSILPDIASSDANLLIRGETGTGKSAFARLVHKKSNRRNKPFLEVNCGSFADSLLESELFGHEKGAFTGAHRSKDGRFSQAKDGTVFLDEIGEITPELQVKLLHVLEERIFEKVGGSSQIFMQARVISATNRNLDESMNKGIFRKDLFYRLKTISVTIPPLRERLEDIPLLTEHFIKNLNSRYNKKIRSVDHKILRLFANYDWPGNVRELERILEHAFVFVKGPVIFPNHLPDIDNFVKTKKNHMPAEPRSLILEALFLADNNRENAAKLLGISRTSLWRKIKQLGINVSYVSK